MSKTIDAMKKLLAAMANTDFTCRLGEETDAVERAIAAEEAQTNAQRVQESYDQQSLEPCDVCGWKAIVPGEPCLMCERHANMCAPEQEPVAYIHLPGCDGDEFSDDFQIEIVTKEAETLQENLVKWSDQDGVAIPLYTRPQPIAELTNDEIIEIFLTGTNHVDSMQFARAVLAAQKGKA